MSEIRTDAENLKAVRVTTHETGVWVEFGYAQTWVEARNWRALSALQRREQGHYAGHFSVERECGYNTAAGAEKAIAKWLR